eukprot:4980659-Pyramimonas_sp.AAC.1
MQVSRSTAIMLSMRVCNTATGVQLYTVGGMLTLRTTAHAGLDLAVDLLLPSCCPPCARVCTVGYVAAPYAVSRMMRGRRGAAALLRVKNSWWEN